MEIREHLEKAQNPVFYYDNDPDGMCSYVLLRRFIDRGKGVAVRSHPDVDERYAKKAQELNADYVFVLDRPVLGEKFVSEIRNLGLPLVWIDHHDMPEEVYDDVFTYNPTKTSSSQKWKKSEEPVSYWCYRIGNRKEDVWIALMGCIADHHLPDFVSDFKEQWSELWGKNVKEPFDAYYGTEIGRLGQVLAFGLKDSVSHVVQLQNYLIQCRSPNDMLGEIDSYKPFSKKYKEIKKKYDPLIERAKEHAEGKVLFFGYGGDLSMSAEIANELCYLYPDKTVVVAYSSGPITNISLRGDNVKGILDEVIGGFEHASGGGHRDAVGARIHTKDLERFKEEVSKRVS